MADHKRLKSSQNSGLKCKLSLYFLSPKFPIFDKDVLTRKFSNKFPTAKNLQWANFLSSSVMSLRIITSHQLEICSCLLEIWCKNLQRLAPPNRFNLYYLLNTPNSKWISEICRTYAKLQPILSQISLPQQPGRVEVKFHWQHGPSSKTPMQTQKSCRYLLQKPSYNPFCLKFSCHGNQGESGLNFDDTIRLAGPENHTQEPKITTLSYTQPEFGRLKNCLIFPISAVVIFLNFSTK